MPSRVEAASAASRSRTRRSTAATCARPSTPRAAVRGPTRAARSACCRPRRSRRPSGRSLRGCAASGPVQAEVAMFLPIKDFERRVITVMANLDGVTLRPRQQPIEASDVRGTLWVRNREIQAPALAGRALGGRFDASIATTRARRREPAHANRRAGQPAGRGTRAGRAHAGQCRPRGRDRLAGHARRGARRRPEAAGARHRATLERPARPRLGAAGAVCKDGGQRAPARACRRASTARMPRVSRARSAGTCARCCSCAARAARPPARARHRDVRRRDARRAAGECRPLAHRPPRSGEPDEDARPAVERAARTPAAGLARRRGPFGRAFRGARLHVRRRERAAAAGQPRLGSLGRRAMRLRAGSSCLSPSRARCRWCSTSTGCGSARAPRVRRTPGPGSAQAAGDPGRRAATSSSTRAASATCEAELARGTAGMTLNRFTMKHPAFTAEGRGSWLVRGDAAESRLGFRRRRRTTSRASWPRCSLARRSRPRRDTCPRA